MSQLDLFGSPPDRLTVIAAADGEPSGAELSACGRYRYLLWRAWAPGPRALFVLLNPSTADAREDDPTVTRLVERSRSLGCSGVNVVNLYPLRATDPADLWAAPDATRRGERTAGGELVADETIRRALEHSVGALVVGWGGPPARKADRVAFARRAGEVLELVRAAGRHALCLGTCSDGSPKHPLFISYATRLEDFEQEPNP